MDAVREELRLVGSAGFAGALVGLLVAGVGGRVAMRISGALTDPALAGQETANGNLLGAITFGGTAALVVFVGLFAGVLGGVAWAALRPWFAPLGRWRGLAFGLYGLGLAGSGVIDMNNFDFQRFGPVALNIALFASLFVLFGLLVVPVERRVEQLSRDPRRSAFAMVVTLGVWFALLPAAIEVALGTIDAVSTLLAGTKPGPSQLLLLTLPLAVLFRWRPGLGPVTYAVLAVPFAYGTWLTATNAWALIR